MTNEQTNFLTHFATNPNAQTKALKLACITALQLSEWICTDLDFKAKYEGIKKEFAENALLQKVGEWDLPAIKYFLERKGTGTGNGETGNIQITFVKREPDYSQMTKEQIRDYLRERTNGKD